MQPNFNIENIINALTDAVTVLSFDKTWSHTSHLGLVAKIDSSPPVPTVTSFASDDILGVP
jgi:hypothetical protein